MEEEITMQHIADAIRYLKGGPHWYLEDEFMILEMSELGMEKLTLKPLGKAIVDKFMKDAEALGKKGEIIRVFGMPVVISDKVEGWKLSY